MQRGLPGLIIVVVDRVAAAPVRIPPLSSVMPVVVGLIWLGIVRSVDKINNRSQVDMDRRNKDKRLGLGLIIPTYRHTGVNTHMLKADGPQYHSVRPDARTTTSPPPGLLGLILITKKNAVSRVLAAEHPRTGTLHLRLTLGGNKVVFSMLDTGACVSLIEEDLYDKLESRMIDSTPVAIQGVGKAPIPNKGTAEITVDLGYGPVVESFIVVTREVTLPTPVLLGLYFMWRQEVAVESLASGGGTFRVTVCGNPIETRVIPDSFVGAYPVQDMA